MPPLAAWKKPSRSALAPVNAPLRTPKNSDSSRVSGIAPQLTATKGWPARALTSWIARATSSLPVPDSPCTSTGAMLRATFSTRPRTCVIASELPTSRRSGSPRPSAGAASVGGGGGVARVRPIADATTARNWRRSTGLVR